MMGSKLYPYGKLKYRMLVRKFLFLKTFKINMFFTMKIRITLILLVKQLKLVHLKIVTEKDGEVRRLMEEL